MRVVEQFRAAKGKKAGLAISLFDNSDHISGDTAIITVSYSDEKMFIPNTYM